MATVRFFPSFVVSTTTHAFEVLGLFRTSLALLTRITSHFQANHSPSVPSALTCLGQFHTKGSKSKTSREISSRGSLGSRFPQDPAFTEDGL